MMGLYGLVTIFNKLMVKLSFWFVLVCDHLGNDLFSLSNLML